jgi:hypothetical protein
MKTGTVIRKQNYRLFTSKLHGDIFERPVGSGLCFFRDGSRAPTIAEVKEANTKAAKLIPQPLTTADIAAIKEDFKSEYALSIEKEVRAKAEAEFTGRINDLVAERMTTVLAKLNIGGAQAAAIKNQAVGTVSVSEPKPVVAAKVEQVNSGEAK